MREGSIFPSEDSGGGDGLGVATAVLVVPEGIKLLHSGSRLARQTSFV